MLKTSKMRVQSSIWKILTCILIAVVLYILYSFMSVKPTPPEKEVQSETKMQSPLTDHQRAKVMERLPNMDRLVHLDLKGAAPKLTYMKEIFPLFKRMGATGLLIEWEDMFPYDGDLVSLSAKDCYSKEDVKEIHKLAHDNELFVIPLVQTFGHMEFVLKGPEFKHLREHPRQPQVINPHKEESLKLIEKMIDQQMTLQPEVKHIHIGSDEVWALGTSNDSKLHMENYGATKDSMFLHHVKEVAGFIRNKYPLVEVLMWDDMFRSTSAADIEKSNINKLVTPVIWMYRTDADRKLKPDLFTKYSKLFYGVWIATAFKGATGSDQYITAIEHHYANHLAWLRILSNPATSTLNIKGTILTGWQRYDHFGSLCELLPVAIPSLAVCLSVLQHGSISRSERHKIETLLGCQDSAPIQWSIDPEDGSSPLCSYPGHELLEGAYAVKNATCYADSLNSRQPLAAWHKDYNLNRQFFQPSYIERLQKKSDAGYKAITTAEKIMNENLPKYFSEETQFEWMETYIKPLKEFIVHKRNMIKAGNKLDTWPRRPIHKAQ